MYVCVRVQVSIDNSIMHGRGVVTTKITGGNLWCNRGLVCVSTRGRDQSSITWINHSRGPREAGAFVCLRNYFIMHKRWMLWNSRLVVDRWCLLAFYARHGGENFENSNKGNGKFGLVAGFACRFVSDSRMEILWYVCVYLNYWKGIIRMCI